MGCLGSTSSTAGRVSSSYTVTLPPPDTGAMDNRVSSKTTSRDQCDVGMLSLKKVVTKKEEEEKVWNKECDRKMQKGVKTNSEK